MRPVAFLSDDAWLAGQVHPAPGTVGIVIVAGGAQTRVGAHRMFVDLAVQLAAAGFPVLRFDRRGTGDSDGESAEFADIGADLVAAAVTLREECPAVRRVLGVGHCDGATALALGPHAFDGLVLLNIWTLEAPASSNPASVKAHYRNRLLQPASWRRLLTGQVDLFGAIGSLLSSRRASGLSDLAERVAETLEDSAVPHLHILSERDATAHAARPLAEQLGGVVTIKSADHSFSDPAHLSEAARHIIAFIGKMVAEEGLEPPTRGL